MATVTWKIVTPKKGNAYEHPEIVPHTVKSVEDLAEAFRSVLDSGHKGFDTLRALTEHLNFGCSQSPKRLARKGRDLRYSPAQLACIKLFRSLVAKNRTSIDEAVTLLQMQGIEDASTLLADLQPNEEEIAAV